MPIMRHSFRRSLSKLFGALGQYNVIPPVLVDAEGVILQVDVNGNLLVAPGVPALWGLYPEDSESVSGDLGQAILAVRNDSASTILTSANLDYSWIAVDDRGQVFVRTDPSPAEPWQTLRTFAGTVADVATPAAIQVVTGIVNVSALAYPGAGLPGLTVTINGFACTFAVGAPTNLANLLALLNAANPDVVWTAPGPAFVLIGTKATPGNITIGGDAAALAILGLAAGTTGPWVSLPQSRGMVEVAFLPGFSVANAPQEVILRLWRLSADTGGIAEIAAEMRIAATDINTQPSRRFSFDGSGIYATLAFVGGAAPTLTGTLDVRVVYDGDYPIESPTWHAVGPSILALDYWDNAPTQAVYNYSTLRGDGTAVRLGNTTITFAVTAGLATPNSAALCRVRVFIDAATKPLVWEQGRNAILSIAAGTITVNALDGTAITVPATATLIEVMWAGADKNVALEDSAHTSGEYVSKEGSVRRDVPVSSASSDGDWATVNQDADGYAYNRSKAYDGSANADRVGEIAPVWNHNVQTPTTIAAALTVTGTGSTWQDIGTSVEIGTQGYKTIGLWLNIAMGTTTNLRVRAVYKHTAAGADEYAGVIAALDISGTPYNEKIEASYQEFNVDADGKYVLPYSVENYIPYVQFQVLGEVLGATPAVITSANVTYGY